MTALDAPFRPRRGRVVPYAVAATVVAVFLAVAVLMVAQGHWRVGDALSLLALSIPIAALLVRFAMIRATAEPEGLVVRNILITRHLAWDRIVAVHFPEGDPWVSLELADTEIIAVMAIQRADGPAARVEAQRLADLIHSRQSRRDR